MTAFGSATGHRGTGSALVLAALWFAVVGTMGCESRPRPSIVIISVDTARADHLGAYGYIRPTSPNIDVLASRGVLFERAYTPSSHTLGAHASLLTGRYPDSHGLLLDTDSLSPQIGTLAERLAASGYRTAAFTNSGYLDPKFGLDRGFGVYDFAHDFQVHRVNGEEVWGRSGRATNRAVFEWLDGASEDPSFLFVHYFEAHSDWKRDPYDAPPEFRKAFELERPPDYEPGDGEVVASLHMIEMNESGASYPEDHRRYVESLYDGGIAHTDAIIGELLSELERRGLFEESIVVLLSDHGEEFQEHGKLLHVQVFEELVRVPLIIALPGGEQAGRRVDAIVELTDVMPTLLALLDIDGPDGMQGRDLSPVLRGESLAPQPAFSRNQSGTQYSVREGHFKLVRRSQPAATYLFDLDADPGEQASTARRNRDEALRLLGVLDAWQRRTRSARPDPPPARELAPDVKQSLRALGYSEE